MILFFNIKQISPGSDAVKKITEAGEYEKKKIYPLLTLLVLFPVAMVIRTPISITANISKDGFDQIPKEKVVDFLKTTLEPNSGGEVFAAFHTFGKEENKLFIWAYVTEYYQKNGTLKLGSAKSGLMVITFSKNRDIKDHWKPQEGTKYAQSVREEFPRKFYHDVFEFQSKHQDILADLENSVKQKARKEIIRDRADIALRVGETATICLDANRTTGYSWHYKIEDKNIIEVVSDRYKESENKKGALGAGGKRIIEIKGLEKGATAVKFEYFRHWQPNQIKMARKFTIKVAENGKAGFDLPGALNLEYISVRDRKIRLFFEEDEFPPEFTIRSGQISCQPVPAESGPAPAMNKKTIDGRKYCIQKSSEGAAGTIYKKYTYATVKNRRLLVVGFTVQYPQCDNFGPPERTECINERKKFDPDKVASHVVEKAPR